MKCVEVSIASSRSGRRYYTYEAPDDALIGSLVLVEFGSKSCFAIVRSIVKKPTFKLKKIVQILPYVFNDKCLQLATWMEQFYPYDYGDISSLFTPPNILTNSRHTIEQKIYNYPIIPLPKKTNDQSISYKAIVNNKHVLLHGDTGTGKTRVFLERTNDIINDKKSVLILTPEIGLTPQLLGSIKNHCKAPVFVNHSRLTPAQRKIIWLKAMTLDEPAIFIGPRSSIFLPFNNLGLIVADEAHDNSYKNMQSPRYNGIYVASKLAQIHHATFVQSTATPNITDYIMANKKNVAITRMTKVAAGIASTKTDLVNLNDKTKFSTSRNYSDLLLSLIKQNLTNQLQTLIFINRRGSARIVQCNSCGYTEECLNCGVPITFHHDMHILLCHICGFKKPVINSCPACSNTDLNFYSPGTKGLEQELKNIFPEAKIARFDLDVKNSESLPKRIEELKSGSIDIIIGTQIITKGIDLPKLSLVGILNADNSLMFPDYKSEENTFQQLYQVSGRVGRGHIKGRTIIQTRYPNHPVIQAVASHDWSQFFEYESKKRKEYNYPPFTHIMVLKIIKAKQSTAESSAKKLVNEISGIQGIVILGPSPSFYEQQKNKFEWQIIIKSKNRSKLIEVAQFAKSDWQIDIDPINLL